MSLLGAGTLCEVAGWAQLSDGHLLSLPASVNHNWGWCIFWLTSLVLLPTCIGTDEAGKDNYYGKPKQKQN